ncbi:MAG: ATP-binding protein [Clostridia bacterium]|nr:ATP-binding protein [Clostridia bacterium]
MIYSINKSEVISGLIEIKQVIESRLKQLSEDAAANGSVNRTTIHTDAEKFFEDFLNELYGWQLKNANAEKQNAPGVDLIYEGEKVVVQVSNKSTKDKVVESLNKTSDEYKKGGLRFKLVTMQLKHTKYKDSYAAEFDKAKGGLNFDCHKDVIDVTSIIRDVNDATAEKVRALKKVVDDYFERAQARKDLGLKKLGSGKARNLFEFNSGSVGFFGRENEMERLRAFVSGDDPFRWYAIAAPGGAGKTRLAYELQNELEKTGWTCLKIKGENVWKQLGELDGLYPGKTLFIADYVAPHTKELGEWMKKLSQPGSAREPLRLLLLERDTKDEYGRVAWFESLLSADRADIPLCGPDSPEMLRPLGDEYLLGLIRGFSETAVKAAREEGQECRPLEDGEERRIREKLDSIDKNLVRPFYAMLLTDAWVRDPEAPKWEQKDLLGYVTNRERDIIKKRIEGAGVHATDQLVQAVCHIWMAATVLGAGSPVAADKLYEAFSPESDLVKRSAERKAELLDSIELAPHESLLQAAGIFSDGNIIPVLPDILGEFFVLTGVDAPVFRQRLWAAALDEFDSSLEFFKRLLKDFGLLMMKDDNLRKIVFPEDLGFSRYKQLLEQLLIEPKVKPFREVVVKSIRALENQQLEEFTDTRMIHSIDSSLPNSVK